MGLAMAGSWHAMDPDCVTLGYAAEALSEALDVGRGARFVERLRGNFAWRQIL
jgi:hypothetical protein